MSDLSERLIRARELPRHLRELGILVGRQVLETELLSVEGTREVQAHASKIARQPVKSFKIPFKEKSEPRFRAFLDRLADANSSQVYLWTPASNLCGVLRPLSLDNVRIAFPFDLNPEGIVVIVTSDLCNQLLLDYSLGDQGEQLLEIETSGEHWGRIAY